MDNFKYKPRARGKDKEKNKLNKFGKNTSRGERIKSSKISNNIKKKSNI
tara:strand:+ start:1484 stop:1630 length:147 start_codon:yes stop_codon:yes gene_type:complete